jgi:hypothetical protein
MSEIDDESDGPLFDIIVFGFWWLVLLFSAYWWVAILLGAIGCAVRGWIAYEDSEVYRFRKAQREIDDLTKWARCRIRRLGEGHVEGD